MRRSVGAQITARVCNQLPTDHTAHSTTAHYSLSHCSRSPTFAQFLGDIPDRSLRL